MPIKAAQAESAYVKLAPSVKLSHVFTVREHRRLGMGNTLSYGGKLFTLAKPTSFQFNAKTTVEIRETLEGDLILWHQGQALELKETEKVQRKKGEFCAATQTRRKPPMEGLPSKTYSA